MDGTASGRAGDPALLRRLNVSAALRAFLAARTLTVSELQRAVGVSRPTAEDVLSGLLAEGQVEAVDAPVEQRRAGRPARRYRFSSADRYVVGVDVGAHSVACAVTDLRGEVRGTARHTVDPSASAASRLSSAANLVRSTLHKAGVSADQLVGTGCGITGVVLDGGRPVDIRALPSGPGLHPYSLPGFAELDIAARCAEAFGSTVHVGNDIKVAALAKHGHGQDAASGVRDLVYMHAGRRLGSAVMVDGQVLQGRHGLAGEIGAMRLFGWSAAMDLFEQERARLRPPESRSDGTRELFAAAAEGDGRAADAVEAVALALALGASALVHATDPQLVILGGGLSRVGSALAEPFRRHLEETSFHAPRVEVSTLGSESVALGAAQLASTAFRDALITV